MAQVFLYPATGESPLDEDGNPFPSTGLRVTMNAYYEGQCRQGLLVRQDPSAFSAVVQPAVYAPFSLGYVTTQLASIPGVRDGREIETVGRATAADGGGMKFRFAAGVSAGDDDYLKINTSDGQWQACTPAELGYLDPKWFGAIGTATPATVVDCHAAFERTFAAVDTTGIRSVRVTPGAAGGCYGIVPSTASDPISCPGFCSLLCDRIGGVNLVLMTSLSTIGETSAVRLYGNGIRCEGLVIQPMTAAMYPDPRSPPALANQRHGIYVEGYDIVVSDCFSSGTSGAPFREYNSFQIEFRRNWGECGGNHCFWLSGGNTIAMYGCASNAPPEFHAGVKIDTGHAVIIGHNGLFNTYKAQGLPVNYHPEGTICYRFGGDVIFIACNAEDYSGYAFYSEVNRAPKLLSCVSTTARGGVNGTVRFFFCDFVDTPCLLDGTNRIFAPGTGGWGDPTTGVVDGHPFEVRTGGAPFFFESANFGTTYQNTTGLVFGVGTTTYEYTATNKSNKRVSQLTLVDYNFAGQYVNGSNFTAIVGVNGLRMGGAGRTVSLPVANDTAGGEIQIYNAEGAFAITVQRSGSDQLQTAAGQSTTYAMGAYMGASTTWRRVTLRVAGADVLGWQLVSEV